MHCSFKIKVDKAQTFQVGAPTNHDEGVIVLTKDVDAPVIHTDL